MKTFCHAKFLDRLKLLDLEGILCDYWWHTHAHLHVYYLFKTSGEYWDLLARFYTHFDIIDNILSFLFFWPFIRALSLYSMFEGSQQGVFWLVHPCPILTAHAICASEWKGAKYWTYLGLSEEIMPYGQWLDWTLGKFTPQSWTGPFARKAVLSASLYSLQNL